MKNIIILIAIAVFLIYNKSWLLAKSKTFKPPSIVNQLAKQAQDSAGIVLGAAVDNTIVNIVKQIDRLPQSQQEKIRQQICH